MRTPEEVVNITIKCIVADIKRKQQAVLHNRLRKHVQEIGLNISIIETLILAQKITVITAGIMALDAAVATAKEYEMEVPE